MLSKRNIIVMGSASVVALSFVFGFVVGQKMGRDSERAEQEKEKAELAYLGCAASLNSNVEGSNLPGSSWDITSGVPRRTLMGEYFFVWCQAQDGKNVEEWTLQR